MATASFNHAVHMVAVTQIRNLRTEGRAYYGRKLAEDKTGKEALRALKKTHQRLPLRRHGGRRRQGQGPGWWRPGRANGERLSCLRGRLTPRETGSSAKPLPGQGKA